MESVNKTSGVSMPDNKVANGWSEWSRYVLAELKRLNDGIEKLELRLDAGLQELENKVENNKKELLEEIEKLRVLMETERINLAVLRVKAGLWGAISGALATIVVLFVYLLEFAKK